MNYTLEVKEAENGELYIEFPSEMMEALGWAAGDTLNFAVQDDGSIIIKNCTCNFLRDIIKS
jgi:bifunctional DNA-binding transcriptional regulator/antitoxin component of YhaV-PrlF toxin-antitoxin module